MKKLLLTTMCLFAICFAFAQITVSHAVKKEEPKNQVIPYDSTKNWLGNENVKSYIGQTLYVNGKYEGRRKAGYPNFYTTKEPSDSLLNRGCYGTPAYDGVYNTRYEDLVGKYFTVLDVQIDSYIRYDWWFKLQNKNNTEEIVWFKYQSKNKYTFPFITMSYFNYIKSRFVGKKYIFKYCIKEGKTNEFLIENIDFHTGETFVESKFNRWECVDITIEGEFYKLIALFKNQKGNVCYINIDDLIPNKDANKKVYFFESSKYYSLVKIYGENSMDLVRRERIYVGMPQPLLILSWGEPDEINRSSYGPDQYVYGSKYVYIRNGKIEAWN